MPFKSQAQRRKFGELVKQGKIKPAMFAEWEKDTPHKIPERVGPKKEGMRSTADLRDHYKKRFGG